MKSLQPLARLASVALTLAAALVALPSTAHADDDAARAHFRHGIELYDKKQYQAALESFRAAYSEKPSPGIKQNIALSLKFLGRPVEAATAFDEALDEGRDVLKPEVRAAMEQELVGLAKIVATIRFTVVATADRRVLENAIVSVDGKPLTVAASKRPIRLEPGIHVFTAHADGLADPPEKKLSILAGSPVDATFELGTPAGLLTIRPSVPEAVILIDGVAVARGGWTGQLPAGPHRITVSAPDYQTTTADVVISSGVSVEYPITMLHPSEVPGYEVPVRKAPPSPKKRYIVPMLAYEAQGLRLANILGGSKRQFAGGAVAVRGGYRVSKNFALELFGEVGQVAETYMIAPAITNSTTRVTHWQLTPVLRFATAGFIRFTAGTGVGLHGLSVSADLKTGNAMASKETSVKGSGVAASWLTDLGIQVDVSSVFLEAATFFDMHGVGTTRESVTNERMFLSSPSTRAGIRVGLGINF